MLADPKTASGCVDRSFPIQCPGGGMADTPDLGSGAVRCAGSSPVPGTIKASIRTNEP